MSGFLIWKWNETDTSQFTQVSGAAVLTVQTVNVVNNMSGTFLKMSASAPNETSIWLINDIVDFPPNCTVKFSFAAPNNQHTGSIALVFGYKSNDQFLAYGISASNTTLVHMARSGSVNIFGNSMGISSQATNHRLKDLTITVQSNTSSVSYWITPGFSWQTQYTNVTDDQLWGISGANALTGFDPTGLRIGFALNIFGRPTQGALSGIIGQFEVVKHLTDWP